MNEPRSKPKETTPASPDARQSGDVGLANEGRPGGAPHAGGAEDAAELAEMVDAASADPKALPKPPLNRPAPQEQQADSRAQEEERDTRTSGLAGNG
ncbi:hypothetical protein K0B96_15620 [Horticoccus luteus]|uniref:Uncharacterized protein n=1 Tax=Horticoccus luteus TaxID=2862869 RepID=A0A8F9TV73_9BACT|nr:hypothetical protein [Horticoccus luteus]QYM78710.1 hypothetical protein K0B96_15620 [Horticoccus luteus]